MKQEVYNDYKISVDGDNGKFVITAIENKDGDKLDSDNENTEFTSEDEAINAAKAEIDKKSQNKTDDTEETAETTSETETITESEFDKLFNQIILENNLENDWENFSDENPEMQETDMSGYDADPETDIDEIDEDDEQNTEEITVDTEIKKVKDAENDDDKKAIIDDIKSNHSDMLNDFKAALQKEFDNVENDEQHQKLQELIEYCDK